MNFDLSFNTSVAKLHDDEAPPPDLNITVGKSMRSSLEWNSDGRTAEERVFRYFSGNIFIKTNLVDKRKIRIPLITSTMALRTRSNSYRSTSLNSRLILDTAILAMVDV